MKRRTTTAVLSTAWALMACGDGGVPVAPSALAETSMGSAWRADIQRDRVLLLEADAAQADAASAGDFAAGFASFLAAAAVYLPPGTDAVVGAAAIEGWLATTYPAGTTLSRYPLRADVSAAGDFGVTFGHTEMTVPGSPGVVYGKYVAAWVMGSGGWELAGYLPNASPGPGEPPPPWYHDLVDNGVRSGALGDAAEELAGVLAADAAFSAASVAEGTGPAFHRYAQKDGVVLLDGSGVGYGRDVIGEIYALPAGYVLSWTPMGGIAASTGDLAFTWGPYQFELPNGAVAHGKYMSLWEKEPSGGWKFVADAGNSNPAPS
ncbi:MAG: DUF4440 domain-containing protein [Gemmatimonadota bacterium]|jgi:ketosteroid isomerase-like protein